MRMNLALFSCLLLLGCGDDSGLKGGDDMTVVVTDMTVGPDLAMRQPNGVACGNKQCTPGQDCCVTTDNGQVTGATCIAAGGACSGSVLACDGPEDCTGGASKGYCCATVGILLPDPDAGTSGGVSGGQAACTADCAASIDPSGPSLTSRLCGAATDCDGLSIAVPGVGNIMLNKCCVSPMAPGTHFCGTPLFSQLGVPVTCS